MTDDDIERSMAARRREIEAQLAEARKSIADDDIASLEPLPLLLRAARRRAKATR